MSYSNEKLYFKCSEFDDSRKDLREHDKHIPNVFTIPKCIFKSSGIYPSEVIERDKTIPNVFQAMKAVSCANTPTSEYAVKFVNYPNLFTLPKSLSEPSSFNDYLNKHSNNYSNIFLLSSLLNSECEDHVEKKYSNDKKSVHNDLNQTPERVIKKIVKEEDMSTVKAMWCILMARTVCENPNKSFPIKEIDTNDMVVDIKRLLTNRGAEYFIEDPITKKYKLNGMFSIYGISPDIFENITFGILECANLFKALTTYKSLWENDTKDNITLNFMFTLSQILSDFERSIYAVTDDTLFELVGRLKQFVNQLQILANICDICINEFIDMPTQRPSGVHLLNKVHDYLINYQLSHDVFLRMLIYIFDYCCMLYFRILSDWTLKGELNDHSCMFIKMYLKNNEEESCFDNNYDDYYIDEDVAVPDFFKQFKNDILCCGRSVYLLNKLKDIKIFSQPTFTCCFDHDDTEAIYIKSCNILKCNSDPSPTNVVNEAPNIFVTPDWNNVEKNDYDLNNPYGFFMENNKPLIYHNKPIDIVTMLDCIPYTLLIPSNIKKKNCNKEILNIILNEEQLVNKLNFLSQCFFLVNSQFSSKFCDNLYESISINRKKSDHLFNSNRLSLILDEAIQDSFTKITPLNITIMVVGELSLDDSIQIEDVESIELNYLPTWPMNILFTQKIILKYKRIFMFSNKLEYVTWCLSKAREILSLHKFNTGVQFRQINLFKHAMYQFITSMHHYYKQVVISTCWMELIENLKVTEDINDVYNNHKQYLHNIISRCFMIKGLRDKLIFLNKIYIEIINYYRLIAQGNFYMDNSILLHSKFEEIEKSFLRFSELRRMFYESILNSIETKGKHSYVSHLENLITILGPS
ncbi:uncharacterized protein LOC126897623 isoform X2 [Daktulosphaira vitifoliae]|uniref:uncharacterized protein LOC126897623 isoform X2 n=1 Tax=Daktulosphaira vitifoliae TaxID=58002 RepID=UPI0021AA1358|nr:uncharacterized protein LOC126897623 isoform X2 [Daktulosphaira vitifoliae]